MNWLSRIIYCVLNLCLLLQVDAHACPRIESLIDYNCDQDLKIAVTGDSIVKGTGDLPDEDGYVARLREDLPGAKVTNLGVAGITSYRLLRAYKKLLSKPGQGETKRKTADADVLVIDVGRNDFWGHQNAALTVSNIKRLVKYLKLKIGTDVASPPYIVVATLLPTLRAFQEPFIDEVNSLLLHLSSPSFPVLVRFDAVSKNYLSEDGLHPSPEGYVRMGDLVFELISGKLQKKLVGHARDHDKDGIADFFEVHRYLTNRHLADTDADGFTDGSEIFTYGTNPLDPLSIPIIP